MASNSFWSTNIGKTVTATAYVSASAGIGWLIAATNSDPVLFGPVVTVLINALLVLVKKTFFDGNTPNLGR